MDVTKLVLFYLRSGFKVTLRYSPVQYVILSEIEEWNCVTTAKDGSHRGRRKGRNQMEETCTWR
ncbi:hypothetical protein E2C01_087945 [Portunus trituberculatus]|uniref:Uncharacterized protein n=1 Tax=Portunus trituberculatus TaxID=210409 RepID=A0A5B7JE26_PORTR|nr:hypothetical protein [Portunus trituberculatus]